MGRPLWRPPPGNSENNSTDDANKQPVPPRCISPPNFHTSSTSGSSSAAGPEAMVMRNDSSMLTLDEFLRETSTRDSTERQLQGLLALRRRIGSETRPGRWGSLYDHTPAGRRRILEQDELEEEEGEVDEDRIPEIYWNFRARVSPGSLPLPPQPLSALPAASSGALSVPREDSTADVLTGPSQLVQPPMRTSGEYRPYVAGVPSITWPPLPPPSSSSLPPLSRQDSFDTLVSQIRRIGALQDFMLNSTTTPPDPPTPTATAATVASLRIREARLRAMQTRIDLLANEFAVLSSTRREMRRAMANDAPVPAPPPPPPVRMSESLREELMRSAVMRMQIEALPL
ncbi:uncharacterized protein LAJ45_09137 [Morchella importuna]|uniref:uncharacterized protein n=1 Tax=Morchella importuna TaxID=1174673 RepID=UPI001E8D819E|nr:uncharacterized protein LAJ45_09137 [Morchella importuna]KAH8146763.1 hypothetical protein LAJ45_09137 [Morchella importuna]